MMNGLPRAVRFKILVGLCLPLALIGLASTAQSAGRSDPQEVLVIGSAKIIEGNVVGAKDRALSDALVKGFEVFLGRFLGDRAMADNFRRILEEVVPKAREQVANFNILAEERTEGYCKVLVRVRINESVIAETLEQAGLTTAEASAVRILFLVSQVERPADRISSWWTDPGSESALTQTELVLHKIFQKRGFSPIGRLLRVPERDYPEEMRIPDLGEEAALEWGRVFSADAVVYGRCDITKGKGVTLSLQALDVRKSGRVEGGTWSEPVVEGPGTEDAVMAAIEAAVEASVSKLGPALREGVKPPAAGLKTFAVSLEGLRNYKVFNAFMDFLRREVPGVKTVRQSRVRGGLVTVAVEYSGEEGAFLDAVLGHEDLPFPAEVSRTEEGGVIIHVRQPEPEEAVEEPMEEPVAPAPPEEEEESR